MDNNDIIEVRKNYWYDTRVIPSYIDGKRVIDKKCYDLSQEIYLRVGQFIKPSIFTNKSINKIADEVNELFLEILDLSEDLMILIYNDFVKLIEYYIEESVENEMFEISSNLTKFINHFNNKNILDDGDQ